MASQLKNINKQGSTDSNIGYFRKKKATLVKSHATSLFFFFQESLELVFEMYTLLNSYENQAGTLQVREGTAVMLTGVAQYWNPSIFGFDSEHEYHNHPNNDIQAVPMPISNCKPNGAQVIFCFHPNFRGVCAMEFDSTECLWV